MGARGPSGVAARLLGGLSVVVLTVAATAWVIASVVGPRIFHDHMLMAEPTGSDVVAHAEEAFIAAGTLSLGIALLAALLTSVMVSLFLTRRITKSLDRVRQAAARVASGDHEARVPAVHMGAEFDELADAFNTMAAELEQIEQTRTRMLADLAHEMRTPVATLEGYLEGMTDGVVQADGATVVLLREQVGRLTRLAQDIALVTEAGDGRWSMRLRQVPVGELLDHAVAQASGRFADKGVELQVVGPEQARRSVLTADRDRLAQVLTNLLDNALRHTPDGGRVELGTEHDGGLLRLWVRDTGGGIEAEHLPHLFERFYRVDTARDRAHGGSGIGLAIVRSIVRAHGGTVSAASAGAGHGAVFTVELPAGGRPTSPDLTGRR